MLIARASTRSNRGLSCLSSERCCLLHWVIHALVLSPLTGVKMPALAKSHSIRIGLVADEPIRIAGQASIFELPAEPGKPQFVPVIGTPEELVSSNSPDYIVVDLHASTGMAAIDRLRHARPDIRLIVIGPEGDDELVMNSIIAGARAYLPPAAGPNWFARPSRSSPRAPSGRRAAYSPSSLTACSKCRRPLWQRSLSSPCASGRFLN